MRGYLPTTPDQMGGRGGVGEGGGEQWKELEELAQRKQVREGGSEGGREGGREGGIYI